MEFKELQHKLVVNAKDYGRQFGVTIDQDFALLKLYEEVGEYAQAVLIHRKQSRPEKHVSEAESKKLLAAELADILGLVALNADLFGLDLEQAFTEKWFNRKRK